MTEKTPTPDTPTPNVQDGWLDDTREVARFMEKFGQPVLKTPNPDPDFETRRLRAKLVMEEALELAEALGVAFAFDDLTEPRVIDPKSLRTADAGTGYDIVETLDALADLSVVVKGSGVHLGLPVDETLLTEVAPSNMSKMGADGNPIYNEDGKIMKGPGYFPPTPKNVIDKYMG